jgi:hypothetical protein
MGFPIRWVVCVFQERLNESDDPRQVAEIDPSAALDVVNAATPLRFSPFGFSTFQPQLHDEGMDVPEIHLTRRVQGELHCCTDTPAAWHRSATSGPQERLKSVTNWSVWRGQAIQSALAK